MKKIILSLIVLGGCLVMLSACGSEGNSKTVAETNAPDTKVETVKASPAKEFVEGELDAMIRSVSSLVDTTWQFNVNESLDKYREGTLTKEMVINDLQLASNLFDTKAKEVDDFKIPTDIVFHHTESTNKAILEYVTKLKEDLATSVRSASDASKYYIQAVKSGEFENMTQEDIDNLVIAPNTNIQLAALDYKFIMENVE